MSTRRRASTVRVQLTLWHVGTLLVVLAVYTAGVFTLVNRSALQALDERVRSDFQWAAEMWEQRPDGTLTWFEGEPGQRESPWLQVWSSSGQLLYRTSSAAWYPIEESARLAAGASDRIVVVPGEKAAFRVLSGRSKIGGKPVIIQVARSETSLRQDLHDLMLFLAMGLPFAVAAAGLGGHWLARRALAPIEQMAERARSIAADRLSERLPVHNPHDELGRLATVFNDTLGRLEASFGQMRRFTSDVSHELRTPLTAMRTVGEVGLRERRSEHAYREIIGSMLEEVDRLSTLVARLLTLSRVESGQATLSIETVDLRELAADVAAQLGVLAEERGQSIEVAGAGRPLGLADRLLLRQALTNVVDNAINYTPGGGRIDIRVSASPTAAIIDVSDTGPGIAPSREARIFDRFYRGATSDSASNDLSDSASDAASGGAGGAGLGLAIAKWAMEATGGQLLLEPARGSGSTFRIVLPTPGAARTHTDRFRAAG